MNPAASSVAPATINYRSSNRARLLWRVLDWIIGGLFIYAGTVKILDPVRFGIDIDNFKILPWSAAVRLAFYLPWLELFCGFALVGRRFYEGGLTILTGLMLVFIGATIAAKARGLDITCGCFGHASKNLSFTWHLILDLAILGGLIALWIRDRRTVDQAGTLVSTESRPTS